MPAKLPFPDTPHAATFRLLARWLKDKVPHVKTWRSWEGKPDDAAEPSAQQAPWVRLTPGGAPGFWVDETQHQGDLVVRVETFTAGLRAEDAMNLWGAIVKALYPGDRSFLADLGAANGGNSGYLPTVSPPETYTPDGSEGNAGVYAVGMVRVKARFTTLN